MAMSSRLVFLLFVFFIFTFYADAAAIAEDDSEAGLCKIMKCGKGKCNAYHSVTGQLLDIILPACECDTGWTQPTIGVSLPFLPCVIPNCSIDTSCSKKAPSSALLPFSLPSNSSGILNPCAFSLCGEGSCEKTSDYGYRCNCEQGYENLINMPAGPCVRECSIGADCSALGISMGGSRTTTPSPAQDISGSHNNKSSSTSTPSQALSSANKNPSAHSLPLVFIYISAYLAGAGKDIPYPIASAILSLHFLFLLRY